MEKLKRWKAFFASLPSGESVLTDFLSSQPDSTASYSVVAKKLVEEDVLGFGVEPIEIIFEAEQKKKVTFDRQTQRVTLNI